MVGMVDISTHNRAVYGSALTAKTYQVASALKAPEASILSRIRPEFLDKRILDVGVGGGRTTSHLLEISRNYVGIDYSPVMIAQCRARNPGVPFEVCDVRDLSRFGTESFDLIFFSFNGLDYINHADRLRALDEIHRTLARDGAFVFSSHNRDYSGARSILSIRSRADLRTLLRTILYHPDSFFHRAINVKREEQHEDYAILNDVASNYRLLTYYISIDKQVKQLGEARFDRVEAVGVDGRWIRAHEYAQSQKDPWIYYVCRRREARSDPAFG